jgi:hypothetical protein
MIRHALQTRANGGVDAPDLKKQVSITIKLKDAKLNTLKGSEYEIEGNGDEFTSGVSFKISFPFLSEEKPKYTNMNFGIKPLPQEKSSTPAAAQAKSVIGKIINDVKAKYFPKINPHNNKPEAQPEKSLIPNLRRSLSHNLRIETCNH